MEINLFNQLLENIKYFILTYSFLLKIPITMFIVITPLAIVPIFVSITSNILEKDKIKIIRIICLVSSLILFFFALTGRSIFNFLGIDIPSFMIAAGILLFSIGFNMLKAEEDNIEKNKKNKESSIYDIAITPIAIPLIAGPATISYIILLQNNIKSSLESYTIYGSILINIIFIYWMLKLCIKGAQWINPFFLKLIKRITGMILSSMAIQIILSAMVKIDIIKSFSINT